MPEEESIKFKKKNIKIDEENKQSEDEKRIKLRRQIKEEKKKK